MDKDKFLELELEEQVDYLNKLCEEGKDLEEITGIIDIDKRELGKYGLYYVKGKFMGKPMRGYQTSKRSGNEVSKFDGAERLDKTKGQIL